MSNIIDEIEKVVKGKREKIELILAVFFAGGHILLEDIPGVGKTTIAKTISEVLGLTFTRVQFTSDLLPSDILGINYFDMEQKNFILKKGPIFTEILLVDEINRAMPKTQSALLESMEEKQVTLDKVSYSLSDNFFVIATQNPLEEVGTFPLPISQLDRFMASISIGYPSKEAEKLILKRQFIVLNSFKNEVEELKKKDIFVDDKIIDLILKITQFSRSGIFEYGLSTRAALALLNLSKGWALIKNRDFVIDEDVMEVLPYVIKHRLTPIDKEMDILNAIKLAL
ncbi:MAG: AAA family ATPase [Nautilia sp.]|nr:MAG: AAA family ATPase [Nautilia sp.]